eukprot:TRINITY_DN75803_c0_g1_i1.p1 TRINITY_DN75803_c0_g1~~TRINITY_DN75803_c0_g1_i1.p1  ORF type:complete len:363 (+),score=50.99 TRINITY_DN75803_c0_g1_i1:99-1187(+)
MVIRCVVFAALLQKCLCAECLGGDVDGIEPELLLLQLGHDMNLSNDTALLHHGLHKGKTPVGNAGNKNTLYNFSDVSRFLSLGNHVEMAMQATSVSGGMILLHAFLVFALAGVFVCCWNMYYQWQNEQGPHGGPAGRRVPVAASRPGTATKLDPRTSMGAASVAASSVGAAPPGETDGIPPPPVLCPDLVVHTQESRFRMSLQDALDDREDKFPIMSPSGHTNFEAWIEAGRVLCIQCPGQGQPRIMMASPASEDINMLNILDSGGSSWGTISLIPGRHGVYLFSRKFLGPEPAVRIRVLDLRSYRMQAESLSGSGTILASFALSGHLTCTVRSGVDPVLFLATFLSLLVLKPTLLEFASGH